MGRQRRRRMRRLRSEGRNCLMIEEEIPLSGGNISSVVRVGETVRRPIHPWSFSVHKLLIHLERKSFPGSPRFLGIDEKGREILTFMSDEAGYAAYLWSGTAALTATARLLRGYHDACSGFAFDSNDQWQFVYPDRSRHEVICHNDFGPYNLVCKGGVPSAIIDFDFAGPAPRLRDVAYAAYWMTPLSFSSDLTELSRMDVQHGCKRLRLFCGEYGIDASLDLLDMVDEFLCHLGDWLEQEERAGNQAAVKLIRSGHLLHWRKERDAFRESRSALEGALLES